jgi:hypothetical protein
MTEEKQTSAKEGSARLRVSTVYEEKKESLVGSFGRTSTWPEMEKLLLYEG